MSRHNLNAIIKYLGAYPKPEITIKELHSIIIVGADVLSHSAIKDYETALVVKGIIAPSPNNPFRYNDNTFKYAILIARDTQTKCAT
jgi:hypothetical protein